MFIKAADFHSPLMFESGGRAAKLLCELPHDAGNHRTANTAPIRCQFLQSGRHLDLGIDAFGSSSSLDLSGRDTSAWSGVNLERASTAGWHPSAERNACHENQLLMK
jgi:hypothetical protein